jgi:hypothetical protein
MARKSKEFQQLFREESTPHKRPTDRLTPESIRKKELAAHERFKKQVESSSKDKKMVLVNSPKGMKKMSEVLQEFVIPYIDDSDTYEERDDLIRMAVLAWNLALFPPEAHQQFFKEVVDSSVSPFDKQEILATQSLKEFIEELIEWKLEAFPHDPRFIEKYQLTQHEFGFHLSVAYSLD